MGQNFLGKDQDFLREDETLGLRKAVGAMNAP